jgi:hypothetical protein
MKVKDISQGRDPLLRGSLAAMRRAAAMARETAIQTNTGIVIVRDGQMVRVSAEESRNEIAEEKNHD